MTFIQRFIDVNATLYKRHVHAGIIPCGLDFLAWTCTPFNLGSSKLHELHAQLI